MCYSQIPKVNTEIVLYRKNSPRMPQVGGHERRLTDSHCSPYQPETGTKVKIARLTYDFEEEYMKVVVGPCLVPGNIDVEASSFPLAYTVII